MLPPKDFKSFASAVPPLGQILEAPPRLELGVKALQASALPLGYGAVISIYAVTRAGVQKNGGSLAQLGEHLPYKQRVTGSSPVAPTKLVW